MIATFSVRDRGATPRGMARRINPMKKEAWNDSAILFHTEMRDKRFTHAHARAAGYTPRSVKYDRRKLKKAGHTYPLVGINPNKQRTRSLVRVARISTTSKRAEVAYAGARVFNFRNPKSQVNAAVEFTTITQAEANTLAETFDRSLDRQLSADQTENP